MQRLGVQMHHRWPMFGGVSSIGKRSRNLLALLSNLSCPIAVLEYVTAFPIAWTAAMRPIVPSTVPGTSFGVTNGEGVCRRCVFAVSEDGGRSNDQQSQFLIYFSHSLVSIRRISRLQRRLR